MMEQAALIRPSPRLCLPRNLSCMARLQCCQTAELQATAIACNGPLPRNSNQHQSKRDADRQQPQPRQQKLGLERSAHRSDLKPNPNPSQRKRAKSLSPVSGGRWPVSRLRGSRQARSKRVRFADSLGLELTSIKHYSEADLPEVPCHVMAELETEMELCRLAAEAAAEAAEEPAGDAGGLETPVLFPASPCPALELLFPDPRNSPGFLSAVEERAVCLETIATDNLGVTGTIRVLNLAFEKQVLVRYTLNQWRSFVDIPAAYVPDSSDGHTDSFSFQMIAPVFLESGGILEFAIRYSVPGRPAEEHWDNNNGHNYQVRSQRFKVSPPKDWENAWIHFI